MAFSETTKKEVRRRAAYRCCMCEREVAPEIHHIIPVEEGGADDFDNAAPLCPNCHSNFGANPERRKIIKEKRDWWYERVKEIYGPARVSTESLDRLTDEVTKWRKGDSTFQAGITPLLEQLTKTVITTAGPSTENEALTGAYEMFLPRLHRTMIQCPGCSKLVDFRNYCSECGAKLK